MRRFALSLTVIALMGCGTDSDRLVVAAGTTLVDSGLIESVADTFEDETGVEVAVIGDATAQVLALGRSGSVDVTITHAPEAEAAFIADGLASTSAWVFSSRFVILGPTPGALGARDAVAAFAEVAEIGGPFVGRQDGSGTAAVEAEIWARTGIDGPSQAWYVTTGQGMGLTLQVASERAGYVLSELGTFLSTERLTLFDQGVDGGTLENPYVAISVAASDQVDVADQFVRWLASEAGRAGIDAANESIFGGRRVYTPPG